LFQFLSCFPSHAAVFPRRNPFLSSIPFSPCDRKSFRFVPSPSFPCPGGRDFEFPVIFGPPPPLDLFPLRLTSRVSPAPPFAAFVLAPSLLPFFLFEVFLPSAVSFAPQCKNFFFPPPDLFSVFPAVCEFVRDPFPQPSSIFSFFLFAPSPSPGFLPLGLLA